MPLVPTPRDPPVLTGPGVPGPAVPGYPQIQGWPYTRAAPDGAQQWLPGFGAGLARACHPALMPDKRPRRETGPRADTEYIIDKHTFATVTM